MSIHILKITGYRFGITFHVEGESGKEYIVDYNFQKGWICDCPDHIFRHGFCKHMQFCKEFLERNMGDEKLSCKLWCDNPKSERTFENTLATEVIM